ncbi:MAG TPA: 23S rRNA (guanosine(2251)-2'-O)-methyltransferase RlmB [Solirubrobacteraceae bacterium]|nr:23S rRNA (guanosine(2251)-2'-O)-methyltransferase RlmB [Solirubrobacteraceae bacterium]
MIVYGRNAVREALRGRRAASVSEVLASESAARETWLSGVSVRRTSAAAIEQACGSVEHQGVCATLGDFPYSESSELLESNCFVLALDEVQDPQNLGALCRTAECVGVSGVVICERRAVAVTAAVCRASAGAVEHLRIARARNLADFLADAKRDGCWCYGAAVDERAVPYDQPDYSGSVVLVLGAEGHGLRPRVAASCDALITLPLHGRVGSLNVNAAGAALMYQMLQRRRALDRAP